MNIPTSLTLLRILLIPVIIGYILYDPTSHHARIIAFICFVLCGISDFLDGWIARTFNMASDLGRMLDPIADKMLIILLMMTFLMTQDIKGYHIIAVFLIVAREFFISGLREFLGGMNYTLNVSYIAKWKTTLQILAMGFFILHPVYPWANFIISSLAVGNILLWGACIITLYTGLSYCNVLRTILKK